MKVSIRDLKKSFLEKLNHADKICSQYFYFHESKNSNFDEKLEIEGYLCVHRRNYKSILVDDTDWIYIEFLNSNSNSESNLSISHFLNRFELKSFNLFYEHFAYETKSSNHKCVKFFFYIQTDLNSCEKKKLNWSEIESVKLITEECRIFFLITQELVKTFTNDTKFFTASNDESVGEIITDQTKEPKKEQNEYTYIFRVSSKAPVHSLANSQFKSKLRCDVCVEIVPFSQTLANKPSKLIICFMSKFLFYINTLHLDKVYFLKTNKELDLSNKGKMAQTELVFFQDSFKINENFNGNNDKFFLNDLSYPNVYQKQSDFVSSIKGTLIEKRLVPSFFISENDFDDILIKHYDLILPNKQLKLVLRTVNTNETVTIFYDTRYCLYPICILPGIEIQINDLIKKGDGSYKSSSTLRPLSCPSFDLINLEKKLLLPSAKKVCKKPKLLVDYLSELNFSFHSFYQSDKSENLEKTNHFFNLKLLFKNSEIFQEQCDSFIKIYGQIIKIYELNLRFRCIICSKLISSCICSSKNEENRFNIEFSTSLLVDDHTSILRINYSNLNIDLRSNQSNFFHSISGLLQNILKNLNEISMIPVPSYFISGESNSSRLDRTSMIYQNIKEKLNNESRYLSDQTNYASNRTINNSILNLALSAQDSSYIFENVVKLDIYKTLYDYLNFCVLDKHYLFYIDPNELHNMKVLGNGLEKRSQKCHKYFRICDLSSNEQFKSILNLKCFKFLPIENEHTDF